MQEEDSQQCYGKNLEDQEVDVTVYELVVFSQSSYRLN
jgi:hypothetical protein